MFSVCKLWQYLSTNSSPGIQLIDRKYAAYSTVGHHARACVGEVDRNAKTTSNFVQHVIKGHQALPPLFIPHARESLERGYPYPRLQARSPKIASNHRLSAQATTSSARLASLYTTMPNTNYTHSVFQSWRIMA